MKIGVDISQIYYEKTGVSSYLSQVLDRLLQTDDKNEYIFFYSSLRGKLDTSKLNFLKKTNSKLKTFKLPPALLDLLWNKLHIIPIESFIGNVDIFLTSDWTEPPTRKAKKATILYDLIIYKYPNETDKQIVETQKRKLKWVKKESDLIFCISEATKKDAMKILGIEEEKLKVIYPGI